jgi:hypothetical protein
MKKALAWVFAWLFFWTGCLCSNVTMLNFAYQWMMGTSLKIQDWGKVDSPWKYPDKEDV